MLVYGKFMNKMRKSNFELLRIAAMFGIVIFHCLFHSGYETTLNSINNAFIRYFQVFGEVSVNVFILITGYFVAGKKKYYPDFKKIQSIYSLVLFYAIIFYFCISIKSHQFSLVGMLKKVIFTYNEWWFPTTFILMLFFIPVVNIVLTELSKTLTVVICTLLFVLFSFIPTMIGKPLISNDIIVRTAWFLCIAYLGGLIRIHFNNVKASNKVLITIVILLIFLESVLTFYILENNITIKMFGNNVPYYYDMFYLPTISISVLVFCIFKNLDIQSKKINMIASYTFDVYLISDYPQVRRILWGGYLILAILNMNGILYWKLLGQ